MTELNSDAAIYRVAVPVPLPGYFDYLSVDSRPLEPGQRVRVAFGSRELVGVVIQGVKESAVERQKLQPVLEVLDDGQPMVTGELLSLLQWCAHYYKHPPGEVLFNALPPALRRVDGVLPATPIQYRLTPDGTERLGDGPGRAAAQYRLLQALEGGALSPEVLRAEHGGTAALLKKLLAAGWVQTEPRGAGGLVLAEGPILTPEQQEAVSAISKASGQFSCHLLDGITGSGKTEVYLQLVAETLAAGKQVLVLVPEIGLTPQLLRRFRDRLGFEPALSHSGMAAGERLKTWAAALRGEANLLMGTRSALFLPLKNPGLIIMDESHDASFKQQDGFRYSARDVAVKRSLDRNIPVVLGTATPSLESLNNARLGRYHHHRLRARATGASEPKWQVVDLRHLHTDGALSTPALEAITETLERQEQVLVFLNRRGYAPVLLCHECGWHGQCSHCDANLTWHRSSRKLHCHHCGAQSSAPRFCPDCRADALQGAGQGTEQLEGFLRRHFPDTPLHRVDRDSVRRKGELEAIIDQVREGSPCILVGTQMLAKGHHFPKVTLVVVVDLDQALYSADYRAIERMGQMLVQVAGRAGRADDPGTVLLQTHHPDHEGLLALRREGFEAFANGLLEEREITGLPPVTYQAALRADALDRNEVSAFLKEARAEWGGSSDSVFGPFPAMMERRSGRFRWYLLFQQAQRQRLQHQLDDFLPRVRKLKSSRKVRWAIDLDPQEF